MFAIKADKISKRYTLGGLRHNALRDVLSAAISKVSGKAAKREFWALKDVSFEIEKGELVGVIGRNGAGKSTLLKILSRITKPTSGFAEIRGRVGSLLEVGTGFHNELSGRENIFLNGAILGMKRNEIVRRFDEIVAFAEVEKFIDTPVKHYSSGMFMRLAFAVAAHLDTEVLFVDEVLAVGDVSFQKKCLGKMKDIGSQGRTVIFVSHDMQAVTRLCNKGILLSKGEVAEQGEAVEVVRKYLSDGGGLSAVYDVSGNENPPSSEFVRLRKVRVVGDAIRGTSSFDISTKLGIEMTYEVLEDGQILLPNFQFFDQDRVHLFTVQDVTPEWKRREKNKGEYVSTVWIPGNFLAEGTISVNVAVVTYLPAMRVHFHEFDVLSFDVVDSMEGDTARGDYAGKMDGVIRPILEWETSYRQ